MPFGDPGGNYASGGAVNQGGPSGPNSPGNNGNMGGGGGSGGSNFSSAYAGSSAPQPGYTISFGWQPSFPGQISPEQFNAFTNPSQWNYGNMSGMPHSSSSGFFGGAPAYGQNPAGGGGANSGQGGMGAGSLSGGVVGLGAGGYNSGKGGMGAGRRRLLARALGGAPGLVGRGSR